MKYKLIKGIFSKKGDRIRRMKNGKDQKIRIRTEDIMLAPSIIVLIAVSIFPTIYLLYATFFNYMGSVDKPVYIGLENWVKIFKDMEVFNSWKVTLIYAFVSLTLETIIGVGIAVLLYTIPKARNIFLTLWMLPIFVAPIVTGLLGRFMLNSSYGLYAYLLNLIGIKRDLLGSTGSALLCVILMDVWEWTPLITIVVLAGLEAMPTAPLESAEVEGATYLQKVWYVMLPLASRSISVALLIRAMDVMRFFDAIFMSTAGGPADTTKIIGLRLYEVAFRFGDIGYAAVIGISMLIVTTLLGRIFVKLWYSGGGEYSA